MKNFNFGIVELFRTIRKAGESVLKIYQRDFEIYKKENKSPLTEADLESNKIILKFLKQTEIPVLSEENKRIQYNIRKNWKKFWLVDPLDGTKEFINKNGEFTIQLALIENKEPVLGIIYWPLNRTFYFAIDNLGSFKLEESKLNDINSFQDLINNSKKLKVNKKIDEEIVIVVSRSHMDEETKKFIEKLNKKDNNKKIRKISKGSSLKFCLIAEGKAHFYFRKTPLMEWDLAPGHIIVKEAGGKVLTWKNEKIEYNTKDLIINGIKCSCCDLEN